MNAPLGRVTLYETSGIHTYVLEAGGSAEIHCDSMRVRLSPEGLHRFLEFLNHEEYSQGVVINREKWVTLLNVVKNVLLNACDAGVGNDADILELNRAIGSLENGLF